MATRGGRVGTKSDKLSFEAALARLEKLVHDMEAGDVTLEEALEAFEEGISLVRSCHQRLNSAEQKIRSLLVAEDGSPVLPSFKWDKDSGGKE